MSSVVTASSPLVIHHDSWQAVAAVVGLEMKYSAFYEHFMNATMSCGRTLPADSCNFTCRSPVSYVILHRRSGTDDNETTLQTYRSEEGETCEIVDAVAF